MRYVIDLKQKQSDQISRLVSLGRYPATAQFILTAIENQLYIEEVDSTTKPSSSESAPSNAKIHITEHGHDKAESQVVGVNAVSSLTDIRNNKVKVLPAPRFEDLACSVKRGKSIEEPNAWLWGQINRIFPVKLGLRVLLASLGKEDTIELESFRTKAGEIALAYGKMLRSHERHEDKTREERVSAGLPIDISDSRYRESVAAMLRKSKRIAELDTYLQQEEFKSINRYRAQFLASMRKDGKLEGAMSYLGFVNLKRHEDNKAYIGLTSAGLDFAYIKNPIIDDKRLDISLSDKEKEYYLEHIFRHAKGEFLAIQWMLRKITSGIDRREQINLHIKEEFNSKWEDSNDVINTQRAGLMARMNELGFIEKEKEGISVIYKISARGEKNLKEFNRDSLV